MNMAVKNWKPYLIAVGGFSASGLLLAILASGTSPISVVGSSHALVRHRVRFVPWGKSTRREVVDDPTALMWQGAKALGRDIPLSVWALATVIASEAGSGPALAKIAIAWAVRNEAQRRGVSVFKLIAPDGKFGSQQGRYAASVHPPSAADVRIAEMVARNEVADPTNGAVQWDSPAAQRKLLARGEPGYTKTPEMVAAERQASGKTVVYLPGVDPDYLRLWRPAA